MMKCIAVILLLVCLTCLYATAVSGTSFGAGACFVSMDSDLSLFKSTHGGPSWPNSDGGFYLAASSPTWRRGCGIRVSLCPRASSNHYKGVLLYSQQSKAAAASTVVRVGAFSGATSDAGASLFQTKDCGGSNSSTSSSSSSSATLTHTDPTPKPNLHAVWTPDAATDDGSNVQLGMIVVRSSQPDWYLSSLTLTPAAASTSACPAVPASACTAACDDMQGMEDMCPTSDYGGGGQGPFFDGDAGTFKVTSNTGANPTTSSSGSHNHDMSGMDMSGMDMSGMSMSMGVFSTKWEGVTILFKPWTLDDSQIYVASMTGIFILAFCVHALTVFHHYLDSVFRSHNDYKRQGITPPDHHNRLIRLIVNITTMAMPMNASAHAAAAAAADEEAAPCCGPDEAAAAAADASTSKAKDVMVGISQSSSPSSVIVGGSCMYNSRQHLFRTMLHSIRFFLSYCIMIIFMTMDVGVTMALIGGVAAAFYVFDNQCVENNIPLLAAKSADCHEHHV